MAETKPKRKKTAERSRQVNIALTEREDAMLDGLMSEVGARRAVVARIAMLDGLAGEGPGDRVQRLLLGDDDRALVSVILDEMHDGGVLLNQIAKRLNAASDVKVSEELSGVIEAVDYARETYRQAAEKITAAMG